MKKHKTYTIILQFSVTLEIPQAYITIFYAAMNKTSLMCGHVAELFSKEVPLVQQVCDDYTKENGPTNSGLLSIKIYLNFV